MKRISRQERSGKNKESVWRDEEDQEKKYPFGGAGEGREKEKREIIF